MRNNLIELDSTVSKTEQVLFCIPEVANRLRLSKFTVRLFIARGELPTVRLGRRVLIHRDDLNKFIEDRRERRGPLKSKKLSELI